MVGRTEPSPSRIFGIREKRKVLKMVRTNWSNRSNCEPRGKAVRTKILKTGSNQSKPSLDCRTGREPRWNEIISKYGLAENEWVQGIYNDRMKWATTYLREHFFGRIRTTSHKTSLLEFMHKFSEVLRHYRNNHLTADFETFYKFSVLTTCLESFEKQAAELYTRNIFKLVKDEIETAGALNMTECPTVETLLSTTRVSILICNGNLKYLTIKTRTCLRVSAGYLRLVDLPCSHIFGVLKHRNAKCVHTSLILKRCTRDAKSDFICSIGEQDTADDIVPTLR
ncbi:hypothetical protein Ahy_B05g076252 isoform B [Arachis hypogaea]|uniref:Protein FAR1-RELATED SEQUENCE n=1 Tax=Arachis hypogaea TaxID=3818 RepID=A0A444Z2T9_ARAHY|nr:hypothetical protein Ahy_B05g076252 isoform B [Arachis hypogaea]